MKLYIDVEMDVEKRQVIAKLEAARSLERLGEYLTTEWPKLGKAIQCFAGRRRLEMQDALYEVEEDRKAAEIRNRLGLDKIRV
jgi:hypothetical protein